MIARTTRRVAAKFGSSLPRSSLKFLRQELERLLEKVQKRSERIADLEKELADAQKKKSKSPNKKSKSPTWNDSSPCARGTPQTLPSPLPPMVWPESKDRAAASTRANGNPAASPDTQGIIAP